MCTCQVEIGCKDVNWNSHWQLVFAFNFNCPIEVNCLGEWCKLTRHNVHLLQWTNCFWAINQTKRDRMKNAIAITIEHLIHAAQWALVLLWTRATFRCTETITCDRKNELEMLPSTCTDYFVLIGHVSEQLKNWRKSKKKNLFLIVHLQALTYVEYTQLCKKFSENLKNYWKSVRWTLSYSK